MRRAIKACGRRALGVVRVCRPSAAVAPSPLMRPSCGALPGVQARCMGKKNKGTMGKGPHPHQPELHEPHGHHAPKGAGEGEYLIDFKKLEGRMERILQGLQREFAGLRGGKADAAMFDHLQIDAYGRTVPLSEVAQVTIKSPILAVINVYDPELISSVSDAIKNSKLDLAPRVDGNAISVPLPKPSTEQRESLVKLISQSTERAKQNIRKARRDAMDDAKGAKDHVPADEVRRAQKLIDEMTEQKVKKAGDLLEKKKKEILTV